MISVKPLYIIVACLFYQTLFRALSEQICKRQESIFGKMLKGFVYRRVNVSSPTECLQACNDDLRCHSFNYVFAQDLCELNNRTKEARPANFVPNVHRYYFKRSTEAVLLGSIPELPAISCKEIKASDGERAVSGNYWFNSVIPGKTIQLFCDMDLEDADECKNSSTPVCHTNAKCQNTIGSFVCSCEPGFSGNAKTCWDINECISSPCDPNATCQNNEGSYVCSCNSGYAGDGTRCEVAVKSCSAYRARTETADGNYLIGIGESLFSITSASSAALE
ncbi:uncharacterized protein [Montipora foliosa]|uniref:uncharacterized protein n=1 Tax=Montipora foliosa TaxID=591990 RepID=UPI0035F1EE98